MRIAKQLLLGRDAEGIDLPPGLMDISDSDEEGGNMESGGGGSGGVASGSGSASIRAQRRIVSEMQGATRAPVDASTGMPYGIPLTVDALMETTQRL